MSQLDTPSNCRHSRTWSEWPCCGRANFTSELQREGFSYQSVRVIHKNSVHLNQVFPLYLPLRPTEPYQFGNTIRMLRLRLANSHQVSTHCKLSTKNRASGASKLPFVLGWPASIRRKIRIKSANKPRLRLFSKMICSTWLVMMSPFSSHGVYRQSQLRAYEDY